MIKAAMRESRLLVQSWSISIAVQFDFARWSHRPNQPASANRRLSVIRITGLPEGAAAFVGQPTQVLQLAQNDFRMFVFEQNTNFKYLGSPNGVDWTVIEDPVSTIGGVGASGAWNDERNYYASAEVLLMVISGGPGTLLGPIVGAGLVVVVKNIVSGYIERWNFLLGAIFVAIVILMPEGLVPGSARLWRLLWRKRPAKTVLAEGKP